MKRLFLLFCCFPLAVWTQNAGYVADSAHQIGWTDGRVPEFNNAFILKKHQVRLNILGRSSWSATKRLEISSYLPILFLPNLSFKRMIVNRPHFATSAEYGFITGAVPLAAGTLLPTPELIIAGGVAGLVHGIDNYLRLYVSYKPNTRLTFSVRGSASVMRIGYTGVVGFAAAGNGFIAAALPFSIHTQWKRFYMGGAEVDYVINPQNAIVLNASICGFENVRTMFFVPRAAWVHARHHFHYMIGLYTFLDPPDWDMAKRSMKQTHIPAEPYAGVYWIFNN